jgi:hypothetical protein
MSKDAARMPWGRAGLRRAASQGLPCTGLPRVLHGATLGPSRHWLDCSQGRPGGVEALASMVAWRTVGRLHRHCDTQRL